MIFALDKSLSLEATYGLADRASTYAKSASEFGLHERCAGEKVSVQYVLPENLAKASNCGAGTRGRLLCLFLIHANWTFLAYLEAFGPMQVRRKSIVSDRSRANTKSGN
jgi:hypothetical protein